MWCRVTCAHTCCRSTKRGKTLQDAVSRWLSLYQPLWGHCVMAFPSSTSIPPMMAPLSQCEKMGLFAIGAPNLNHWRPNTCLYVLTCVHLSEYCLVPFCMFLIVNKLHEKTKANNVLVCLSILALSPKLICSYWQKKKTKVHKYRFYF